MYHCALLSQHILHTLSPLCCLFFVASKVLYNDDETRDVLGLCLK